MLYPLSYEGGRVQASGERKGQVGCRAATMVCSWPTFSRCCPTGWPPRSRSPPPPPAPRDVDPVVRPSDRADAQANGALPLAKQLGRNPRDVAADVLAAVDLTGVATAEIAGPGFINLTVDDAFLSSTLAGIAADERLGIAAQPAKRVVVDYSAPNVAKQMHIGHLRTTAIGDALVRMLDFLGHDVVRENHIGDWGRPFGIHIENLIERGVLDSDELDISALDQNYKEATERFATDPEFAERARARVVLLQSRDPETIAIWNRLVESTEEFWTDLYGKLGVLLTNDDIVGESFYDPLLPQVVDRLAAAGLLEQSDGADVVFPPGFTNREGEPLPLIVRTGAGAYTYATSDLACVIDRVERVKADLMVYVVGAPQALHLSMVFATSAMAGLAATAGRSGARRVRPGARSGSQDVPEPERRPCQLHRRRRRGDRAWAGGGQRPQPRSDRRGAAHDRSQRRHRRAEVRRPVDRPCA